MTRIKSRPRVTPCGWSIHARGRDLIDQLKDMSIGLWQRSFAANQANVATLYRCSDRDAVNLWLRLTRSGYVDVHDGVMRLGDSGRCLMNARYPEPTKSYAPEADVVHQRKNSPPAGEEWHAQVLQAIADAGPCPITTVGKALAHLGRFPRAAEATIKRALDCGQLKREAIRAPTGGLQFLYSITETGLAALPAPMMEAAE